MLWISAGFAAEPAKRLVIIGDSLSEGLGVAQEEAYPHLLEVKIKAAGKNWTVINSGISASTSASAVSRIEWQLKQKPDLILLELGANDGLRGTSTAAMQDNLDKALALAKKNSLKIILVGMQVPPNYGAAYSKAFAKVFPDLAKKYKVPLVPFLLANVAGDIKLNQADGIHPNPKGHEIVAETVFKEINKYL